MAYLKTKTINGILFNLIQTTTHHTINNQQAMICGSALNRVQLNDGTVLYGTACTARSPMKKVKVTDTMRDKIR